VPAHQRKPSRQRVYVEADIYARIELQRRERPRSFGDYLQVAVDAPAVSRAPPRGRRFGPDYAEAHAALGSMQLAMLFGSPLSPRHIVPKGESAAREAVELDETPWLPHQMLSSALSCDTLRRHVAIGPRRCGSREASPFIAANFRVTSNPRETGIGGTSLGGVAALYVLLNRPDPSASASSKALRCRSAMARCSAILPFSRVGRTVCTSASARRSLQSQAATVR
jgi:Putative esterase